MTADMHGDPSRRAVEATLPSAPASTSTFPSATGQTPLPAKVLANRHDEALKALQAMALTVLSVGSFCLLVLATPEEDIFARRERIVLPVFGVEVPLSSFLVGAPLVLILLQLCSHAFSTHEAELARELSPAELDRYPTVYSLRHWMTKPSTFVLNYAFVPCVLSTFLAKAHFLGAPYSVYVVLLTTAATTHSSLVGLRGPQARRAAIGACTIGATLAATLAVQAAANGESQRSLADIEAVSRDFSGRHWSGLSLRGARLTRSSLLRTHLEHVDLARAELSDTTFDRAQFSDVQMTNASFNRASFASAAWTDVDATNAELERASIRTAILKRVRFSGAMAADVDLGHAQLDNVNFRDAKLHRANFASVIATSVDFTNAILDGANFSLSRFADTKWHGVVARRAQLGQMNFGRNTDLQSTRFNCSDLRGSEFPHADFRGAKLRADLAWANMEDARFDGADILGARLVGTRLQRSILVDSTLESAVLIGAKLAGADLTKAGLHQANLCGADLSGASLREANLSYATLAPCNADQFPWALHFYGGDERCQFREQEHGGPLHATKLDGAKFDENTNLTCTDLRYVNLEFATGLREEDLLRSIGNAQTKLPTYLADSANRIRARWQELIAAAVENNLVATCVRELAH